MRLFLLVFCLLFLGSFSGFAQTPDTQTPAVESIFDGLQDDGVTPGLYGLCVAYCEAHDAELKDITGENLNPPDERILGIYNKRKTVDDPTMPCVVTWDGTCPCAETAQNIVDVMTTTRFYAPQQYPSWTYLGISAPVARYRGGQSIAEFNLYSTGGAGRFNDGTGFRIDLYTPTSGACTVFYYDGVDFNDEQRDVYVYPNGSVAQEVHAECLRVFDSVDIPF